jgi:hypothetical protein
LHRNAPGDARKEPAAQFWHVWFTASIYIHMYIYVYICSRKWMVTRPAFSSNSASRPLDGYSEGGNGEVEEGGKGMDGHKARLLFQVSQ